MDKIFLFVIASAIDVVLRVDEQDVHLIESFELVEQVQQDQRLWTEAGGEGDPSVTVQDPGEHLEGVVGRGPEGEQGCGCVHGSSGGPEELTPGPVKGQG